MPPSPPLLLLAWQTPCDIFEQCARWVDPITAIRITYVQKSHTNIDLTKWVVHYLDTSGYVTTRASIHLMIKGGVDPFFFHRRDWFQPRLDVWVTAAVSYTQPIAYDAWIRNAVFHLFDTKLFSVMRGWVLTTETEFNAISIELMFAFGKPDLVTAFCQYYLQTNPTPAMIPLLLYSAVRCSTYPYVEYIVVKIKALHLLANTDSIGYKPLLFALSLIRQRQRYRYLEDTLRIRTFLVDTIKDVLPAGR